MKEQGIHWVLTVGEEEVAFTYLEFCFHGNWEALSSVPIATVTVTNYHKLINLERPTRNVPKGKTSPGQQDGPLGVYPHPSPSFERPPGSWALRSSSKAAVASILPQLSLVHPLLCLDPPVLFHLKNPVTTLSPPRESPMTSLSGHPSLDHVCKSFFAMQGDTVAAPSNLDVDIFESPNCANCRWLWSCTLCK